MMHVTFSDKSMLMDDDTAGALVRYAAALANDGSADTVTVNAFGVNGDATIATMLLSEGASLMIESANSTLPGPDNADALEYLLAGIQRLESPRSARPDDVPVAGVQDWDFDA